MWHMHLPEQLERAVQPDGVGPEGRRQAAGGAEPGGPGAASGAAVAAGEGAPLRAPRPWRVVRVRGVARRNRPILLIPNRSRIFDSGVDNL
jgi:hypothetical protein